MLVDRANLLTLTAPEMTVVGGLRALGQTSDSLRWAFSPGSRACCTIDFFLNLLDISISYSTCLWCVTAMPCSRQSSGNILLSPASMRIV
jgi:catalase (peroxidase I)